MTVQGPSWLAGTLAFVMLATSAYCVGRLVAACRWRRPTERAVDVTHALMGVAMAGMLVPRLNPFWAGGWVSIFAACAAWFGGQTIRAIRQGARGPGPAHHVPHLLACGAMLYMLAVVSSARAAGPAHGASVTGASAGAARFPTLALVLAVAMLGHVVWTTDRLTSLAPVAAGVRQQGGPPVSPRLAACCEIAMGVTMGYMLILML